MGEVSSNQTRRPCVKPGRRFNQGLILMPGMNA
jgi:hypothetical protein